ncbi:metalloregulator ArsR/SmtB family transcription factor [Methanobrevibacter curvatus]|uniref:HTH-type transcriptional repressor CzrA n=1 Tax=Methanobrevibacter curvatus TaxID=49547 RepID=A0A166ENE6_9EURY|nr:metalloregulator ArsR/SmtB family transcription factor [Methanobrevibacter curvatus]KZX16842.1 HTH-type transcriptional repressor CzrA [Methanobrevibacter curvatus]
MDKEKISHEELEEKTYKLKAIADPTRIQILYLLRDGEQCVCKIYESLEKPQSTISNHLNILKKARLLNWRKEGTWIYYKLKNDSILNLIDNLNEKESLANNIYYNEIESEIKVDTLVNSISEEVKIVSKENFDNCSNLKYEEESPISSCCGGNRDDYSKVKNPKISTKTMSYEMLNEFKSIATNLGAVEFGYTKLSDDLILENGKLDVTLKNAIVFTMELDEDIIKTEAGEIAKNLSDDFYLKFSKLSYKLSDVLREKGYKTEVITPNGDLVDLSMLGEDADIGYRGKSGLLISPKMGTKFKVAAILTEIENLPFSNKHSYSWIREYCELCNKCIKECPEGALVKNGNNVEFLKDKCIGCSDGCTICIDQCSFYNKDYNNLKAKFDIINEF